MTPVGSAEQASGGAPHLLVFCVLEPPFPPELSAAGRDPGQQRNTQHDDNDGKGALGRDRSQEDARPGLCSYLSGLPEAWLLPGLQRAGLTELRLSARAPASLRCPPDPSSQRPSGPP